MNEFKENIRQMGCTDMDMVGNYDINEENITVGGKYYCFVWITASCDWYGKRDYRPRDQKEGWAGIQVLEGNVLD